jgi:hypothetical protein
MVCFSHEYVELNDCSYQLFSTPAEAQLFFACSKGVEEEGCTDEKQNTEKDRENNDIQNNTILCIHQI